MKFADHIRGYPSVAVKAKNPIEFFKTFLEGESSMKCFNKSKGGR